jgi:hypothetical protein
VESSPRIGLSWPRRIGLFCLVVGLLFGASYVAGRRGVYSSAQHRLNLQLREPATRVAASSELALQIANAIAIDHPVIPGASDAGSCPSQYAARSTGVVESMAAVDATATIGSAGTRLRDAGWRVDSPTATGRRTVVTAHNRQGVQVVVTEVAGSDASSIEVTVTVPCDLVPADGSPSTTTPLRGG